MKRSAENIGRRIRAFRKRRELTQAQLAKAAEIDASYLSQIENAKRSAPSVELLSKIAVALQIEVKDLIPDEGAWRLLGDIPRVGPLLQAAGIEPERLLEALGGNHDRLERLDKLFGDLLSGLGVSQDAFIRELLRTELAATPRHFTQLEALARDARREGELGGGELTTGQLEAYLANRGVTVKERFLTRPGKDRGIRCQSYMLEDRGLLLLDESLTSAERTFFIAREVAHRLLRHVDRAPEHPSLMPSQYQHVRMNQQADYLATCLLVDSGTVEGAIDSALKARDPDDATGMISEHLLAHGSRIPVDVQFLRFAQLLANRYGQVPYYLQLRDDGYDESESRFVMPSWMFPLAGALRGMDSNDVYCHRWMASSVLNALRRGEGITKHGERAELKHGKVFVQRSYLIKQREFLLTFTVLNHPPGGGAPSTLSMDIPLVDEILHKVPFLQSDKLTQRDLGETCKTCPIFGVCADKPPGLKPDRNQPLTREGLDTWRRYVLSLR